MPNPYWTFSNPVAAGLTVRASQFNATMQGVEAGFDSVDTRFSEVINLDGFAGTTEIPNQPFPNNVIWINGDGNFDLYPVPEFNPSVYHGALPTEPLTHNEGDLYFNSTVDVMYVSDGTNWTPTGGKSDIETTEFTGVAGETDLTVSYDPTALVWVHYNGHKLEADQYTSDTGTEVVLADAVASDDDIIQVTTIALSNPSVYSIGETDAAIDSAISNLINSAPGALDTLQEIATALGNDPNFAATITAQLATKLNSSAFNASAVMQMVRDNDGTGSLVDADLVDGIQGTQLARLDAGQVKTGGFWQFSDNLSLRFGTTEESRIFSNGIHTVWEMTNGSIFFYSGATSRFAFLNTGDFHADGDVTAYSTTVGSDRRLKKDIEQIEDASEKLEELTGVVFTHRKNGREDAGLIAQDVQRVLPEAVVEVPELDGSGTHLNLNYNAVTGLLVEALKIEKDKVRDLIERVEALEGRT